MEIFKKLPLSLQARLFIFPLSSHECRRSRRHFMNEEDQDAILSFTTVVNAVP